MKKLIVAIVVTSSMVLAAGAASAHSAHERIDNRLDRQQARIDQGIKSGELTRKEAKYLKKQQRRLHKSVRKFERDGKLSKKERRKLTARLNRASDSIRDFKHNDRSRARAKRWSNKHYREYWRDARNHRWSHELSLWPRYSLNW